MLAAEAAAALTAGKVTTLQETYKAAVASLKDCNPDAGTCTLLEQSTFSAQMTQAGKDMIANEEANQNNINVLEQKTLEYNAAVASNKFEAAKY